MQDALERATQQRTTNTIAHRLSTVLDADVSVEARCLDGTWFRDGSVGPRRVGRGLEHPAPRTCPGT